MPADCDEWERNCYWLNGKIIVVLLKSLLACHADNWRSVCSVSCSEPLSNDFSRKWLLTVQFHDNSRFYNILSSSSSSSTSPLCVPPTNESTTDSVIDHQMLVTIILAVYFNLLHVTSWELNCFCCNKKYEINTAAQQLNSQRELKTKEVIIGWLFLLFPSSYKFTVKSSCNKMIWETCLFVLFDELMTNSHCFWRFWLPFDYD